MDALLGPTWVQGERGEWEGAAINVYLPTGKCYNTAKILQTMACTKRTTVLAV